jgi:hypothetical protein
MTREVELAPVRPSPNTVRIDRTRRETVRAGTGLALAALIGAGLGGRSVVVAAQDASPEASPAAGGGLAGKYVVVRLRQFRTEQDPAEAQALIESGFVPLNRAIAGFVSYFGSYNPDTGAAIYVGVFADKSGADESNRVAADWLQSNGYEFFEGDPVVYEGPIDFAVEGAA